MARIALICQSQNSFWVSCRSITSNLIEAYKLKYPDLEIFHLDPEMSASTLASVAKRILAFRPDSIAFIDHAPHPGPLLSQLNFSKHQTPLPKILFHVFGDFVLFSQSWLSSAPLLAGLDVQFICASEKQSKLLGQFFDAPVPPILALPFPVDCSKSFHFDPALREKIRKQRNCSTQESIFLYTGRLSLQKQTLLLLKVFSSYQREINSDARLWLAGPIDDLGIPYLGRKFPEGFLEWRILDEVKTNPAIQYLGNLHDAELRELYNAADHYVSFSTHNDEDFGMAPAEAAACGCPLLLSDWGGFSSFSNIAPKHIRLIPVTIGKDLVSPDPLECKKALFQATSRTIDVTIRAKIAAGARHYCSIESVSNQLGEIIAAPAGEGMSKFSTHFESIGRAFRYNPQAPFAAGSSYSDLYRKTYNIYV